MKYILISTLLLLFACSDAKDSSSTNNNTNNGQYSTCAQVPVGQISEMNTCPGATGTYNTYEVVRNEYGEIFYIELYCGVSEDDRPMNQVEYDQSFIDPSSISNNDFLYAFDCGSGSRTDQVNQDTYQNIWQRVP